MSTAVVPHRATLVDLARTPEKAELIAGRLVFHMATGYRPNIVAGRVFRRLADYADTSGRGVAFTDNMGFAVPELSSGRESFSPDAAYYAGPAPTDPMRFVEGPPDFAVEVRSENDYGPAAEAEMADKRADYFEAGTAVVWDVDPVARVVQRYRPGEAGPTAFGPGTEADAEPAVPGWRLGVDWLMA
jgi:Uma2 family endonuclease